MKKLSQFFDGFKDSLITIGIFFAIISLIIIFFISAFWWIIPLYYLLDKLIDKL